MKQKLINYFKVDDVVKFRNTLDEETDRGVALMSAAFLEGELEALLREYFIKDNAVVDEVFSFNGPCGTFSSKIELCYILGLIGKRAQRDFHLIRKIRNEFGHTATPLSFDSQQIRNRCNPAKDYEIPDEIKREAQKVVEDLKRHIENDKTDKN